jgi:hypothetical protein
LQGYAGRFSSGQADQNDLPGVGRIPQGGEEGDPVWGDRVRYQRGGQPLPKIGSWRDTLDRLLSQNEAKSSRERLTLIRLFEELRERGMTAATTPCAAMLGVGLGNAGKQPLQRLCR